MENRPIPAFYCCYLLRSTVRPLTFYVGSTTDPRRRLAQHNGLIPGGATRTARIVRTSNARVPNSLRPWEITCLVHGFPSSLAALQFEWVWQHPHMSRKIPAEIRQKRARTFPSKLTNLYIMLRTTAFGRWPLTLRFFDPDTYRIWLTTCGSDPAPLPPGIKVVVDTKHTPDPVQDAEGTPGRTQPAKRKRAQIAAAGKGGLQGLDISLGRYEGWMEKSRAVLAEHPGCGVCGKERGEGMVVCPHALCEHTAHVECLAKEWLGEGEVLPVGGTCPECGGTREWGETVRELSARTRMTKTQRAKEERKRKGQAVQEEEEEEEDDDEEMDELDDMGGTSLIDMTDIPEGNEDEVAELLKGEDVEDIPDIKPAKKSRPKKTSTAKKTAAGRKSSRLDILEENSGEETATAPVRSPKRPRKTTTKPKVPSSDASDLEPAPKPKSRRPRKVSVTEIPDSAPEDNTDSGSVLTESSSPPPKKSLLEQLDLADFPSALTQPASLAEAPKRRGRPRKSSIVIESTPSPEPPKVEEETPAKRGRGGPRKTPVKVEELDLTGDGAEQDFTRKEATSDPDGAVEEVEPQAAPRRGRGRPREVIDLDSP